MPINPRLFSVPLGLPFLPEAVRALLENRLIDGMDMRDPDARAKCLIYVPSRWAARALRSAFVEAGGAQASFLPDIQPLGEADNDDFSRFAEQFSQSGLQSGFAADAAANAPMTAAGALERQALLARLIRPWRENLPRHIRALFGREAVSVPANAADALWLARALADCMDEMETEGADPQRLQTVAPENLAEWWQITADFLQHIFAAWPAILAERQLVNPAALRNRILRAAALRLRQAQSGDNPLFRSAAADRPVLVFGSAGTIPAAAELIKTIAYLPRGAVALPGLDRDLDAESWQKLDCDPHDPAAFAHPQFALKKLLRQLNAKREDVVFLGRPAKAQRLREKWISEIFRPAGSTEKWRNLKTVLQGDLWEADDFNPRKAAKAEDYLSTVSLIEAPNGREEALAIAVRLAAALEDKKAVAALVTGNRLLARRVCGELARFGIEANDSGAAPLAAAEPSTLLRLLLACIFTPGDAAAVLAVLKHPLTRLGFSRPDIRRQAEDFEFFALRGGAGRINLGAAEAFIGERLQKLTESGKISRSFTAARMDEAMRLGSLMTAASAPLYRFAAQQSETDLAAAMTASVETLENFGRDEQGSLKRPYAGAAGQKLISFCRRVLADSSGLRFRPQEWPQIFDALIADETVENTPNGHKRLFILGMFEARLQNFDTVVIGGLNEGLLPANPKNSPFLSRTMKLALGLPPPEQKIGFAAHDVSVLLGMKNITLTRSLRQDNAPSVASRWLQRLETVLGAEQAAALKARGNVYLEWAQNLDKAENQAFAARPCPKPPLRLRPTEFSVTEIETLRRNPYAVYARRILRLKPLDPLLRDENAAERGTLYHAILAAFSQFYAKTNIQPIKAAAEKQLLAFAAEEFAKLQLPPDIAALWWPRFAATAKHYLEWEAGLSQRRRCAEIIADKTAINATGSFLTGRADRIDILAEKGENSQARAEIIDFKTGSSPSKKQAHYLAAPQLALEGALLARGAFRECGRAEAENLLYLRLKADGSAQAENIAAMKSASALTAAALAEKAWTQLERLIRHFQNPNNGYLAQALPPLRASEGDYDHLARIAEWSAGTDAPEGDA